MIILAYGLPGTGKSALLHDLTAAHAQTHRVLCCDHEDGWGPEAIYWRGNPPENLTLVESEAHYQELEEMPEDEWPRNGVWVFRNIEPARVAELATAKGDAVFVDDEIDALARREGWEKSALRKIAHEGRHLPNEDGTPTRLHIIGACRRPQNLHIDIATLVDQVYIFRIQGHRTLERLVNDSVIDKDRHWNRITSLPNLHFLHWPTWTVNDESGWLSLRPLGSKKTRRNDAPDSSLPHSADE